jgi:glycosyltransferase involved in cell wall biosynthesis
MMEAPNGYSIAIPAYGRPIEFEELLVSINNSKQLPNEVIICEDCSKQRLILNDIATKWAPIFEAKGCKFTYIENEVNLSYDANIRKLIQMASFKWVILIGNDDLFVSEGLNIIDEFCGRHPDIAMISRPFLRFNDDINSPIGISRFFSDETIVIKDKISAKYIFRVCGFFGGLIVNKNWAEQFHTKKYDGSLFYQIYLACHAYCTNGIGYLAKPTVAAKSNNVPLFGEAGAKGHIPGSYSPKARAAMWAGVLHIAKDVGEIYKVDLHTLLKRELTVQQSFHVFEMNAVASRATLKELKLELKKLDLYDNWMPKLLYYINYILGSKSKVFYFIARKLLQ